jgi:hypothetical protein
MLNQNLSSSAESKPKSYVESSLNDCWKKVMTQELETLQSNKTWKLVDLPLGVTRIGSKWIFEIKRKQDGTVDGQKQDWLQKHIIKGKDWTTLTPILPSQNHNRLDSPSIDIHSKSIVHRQTMLSPMDIFTKTYI